MSEENIFGVCETATSKEYPVRPDDVLMNGESSDASTFGTAEVEKVAGHLLAFFKSHGYWCEFTIDELRRYYEECGWDPNIMFYGLMGMYTHYYGAGIQFYKRDEPMLIAHPDGKYWVTNLFIDRCADRHKKSV